MVGVFGEAIVSRHEPEVLDLKAQQLALHSSTPELLNSLTHRSIVSYLAPPVAL
jgi:hypothetical protein